jgi:sulfonate transport system permease protein
MSVTTDMIADETGAARPRLSTFSGQRALLGLILPLGAAVLYEAAFRAGLVEARLLPAPSRILATLFDLAQTGELWTHVLATVLRVLAGFVIGAGVGTALGALTGASETARRLLDPTLQALRAIPSLAWVPLFILWLGIFEASKITLIAVGVFFPVYLGVMGAIANIDRKIVEVGRVFRLSRLQWRGASCCRPSCRIMSSPCAPASASASCSSSPPSSWAPPRGSAILLVDGQQLGKPDQIVAAIIAFAMIGKAATAARRRLAAAAALAGFLHRGGAMTC